MHAHIHTYTHNMCSQFNAFQEFPHIDKSHDHTYRLYVTEFAKICHVAMHKTEIHFIA